MGMLYRRKKRDPVTRDLVGASPKDGFRSNPNVRTMLAMASRSATVSLLFWQIPRMPGKSG
jgi:hypothetical protein